jgi:hypothetical protein
MTEPYNDEGPLPQHTGSPPPPPYSHDRLCCKFVLHFPSIALVFLPSSPPPVAAHSPHLDDHLGGLTLNNPDVVMKDSLQVDPSAPSPPNQRQSLPHHPKTPAGRPPTPPLLPPKSPPALVRNTTITPSTDSHRHIYIPETWPSHLKMDKLLKQYSLIHDTVEHVIVCRLCGHAVRLNTLSAHFRQQHPEIRDRQGLDYDNLKQRYPDCTPHTQRAIVPHIIPSLPIPFLIVSSGFRLV